MCAANRDRPNHRSTAFGIITVIVIIFSAFSFFTAPALANDAEFYVSDNGTVLNASVHMINQDKYYLTKPGIFGDEAELEVNGLLITAENGTNIEYDKSGYEIKFPAGNYTMNYSAKIENNLVYAHFPVPYNVTVYLPENMKSGHLVLGQISSGGVIGTDGNNSTIITFTGKEKISAVFYESYREPVLYWFLGIWSAVLIAVYLRYRAVKKKNEKIKID